MKIQRLFLIPWLALCACGSSTSSPDDVSSCRGSSVAGVEFDLCPPTWDETSHLPCSFYEDRISGVCEGDRRVFSREWGSHGVTCTYANSTGLLVGAIRRDDVPIYCNQSSSIISAGEQPACTLQPSAADGICKPDSGVGVD